MSEQGKPQAVVNGKPVTAKVRRKPPKRLILGMLVILVLIGLGAAGWSYYQQKIVGKGVCSDAVLKQASANFDPSKQSQLQKTVDQIRALPNYQKDPNCMYVALTNSINVGNVNSAKSDLNQLLKVYDTRVGFKPSLGFTKSISLLEYDVSFVEIGTKKSQQNTTTFGNPQ